MGRETSNSGIGVTGALQVMFIGLKLANVIQWSWIWVLAPSWAALVLGLVLALIVLATE